MSTIKESLTFKEILQSPSEHIHDPMAVVSDTRFDTDQKIQILRGMEQEARQLSAASDENMPGDDQGVPLDRISDALRAVDPDAADHDGASKV